MVIRRPRGQFYNQLHTFFHSQKEWKYNNLTHIHIVLGTILSLQKKKTLTTEYKKQTMTVCTKIKRAAKSKQERTNTFQLLSTTPFPANMSNVAAACPCLQFENLTRWSNLSILIYISYIVRSILGWGLISQCLLLSVGDPGTKGTKPLPPNIGRMKASSNFRQ